MFTWLVYLLAAIGILFAIVAILCIIILYILHKFKKASEENPGRHKITNIFYRIFKHKKIFVIFALILSIIASYFSFSMAIVIGNFNDQFTSFVSMFTVLFGKDDCICYAECTDNPEDDNKCVYELLFGPTEYEKLVNAYNAIDATIKSNLLSEDVSGREKSNILKVSVNDSMVACYKAIVGNNRNFRHDDKKDRTKMTDSELKADLISLLSDYKVNGRNPNCDECKSAKSVDLGYYCIGEAHYVPGWTWEDTWSSNDTNPGGGNSSNNGTALGHATGQYAITLDDGLSYYWYHQSQNCNCVYCGTWSKMDWGSSNFHYFGKDGCAVYSMAMIVSNLIGQEITPVVLLEALGCTITQQSDGRLKCDTSTSECFTGRLIKREKVAEKVKAIYGIEYKVVSSTSEISSDLLNDSIAAMMWDQWADKNSSDAWKHGSNDFSWYPGTGHFMAVRKEENGKWYCLSSCGNSAKGTSATQVMQSAEDPSNVFSHTTGASRYMFYVSANTSSGNEENGGGTGGTPMNPPNMPPITDQEMLDDIAAGKYTAEDYNYLVALGGESSSYEGFYAVACCVRNRVNANNSSYRIEVTKSGQFAGYHSDEVGKPRNENVKQAALAVLRGGASTVGTCYFFLGRVNGYDMWAEPNISDFYNWGGNVFFNGWGNVHNKKGQNAPSNGIIIYNHNTSTWVYPSGTHYSK